MSWQIICIFFVPLVIAFSFKGSVTTILSGPVVPGGAGGEEGGGGMGGGGGCGGMPPPPPHPPTHTHTHFFCVAKRKKGRQRQKTKVFKAETTIKGLSPRSKYYGFSHSRASRIRKYFLVSQPWWLTILFSVP